MRWLRPCKDPTRARGRVAAAILGRRSDRLTARLAVGILVLVIGPLVVAFAVISSQHHQGTIESHRRSAELQNRLLESALRRQMMQKDPGLLAGVLEEISAQPEVLRAMILDHSGEVRLSSEAADVGTAFARDSPTCIVCHSKEPDARARWTVFGERSDVLRSVLPIENRAECHACHDPEDRLNGILIMDVSLQAVQASLSRDRGVILVGAAVMGLLLLVGLSYLVRRLILVRLARLGSMARSIAAGNLSDRAAVEGDDVISSLASDFNDMAGALSRLVGEVRDQEQRLSSVINSLDDGLVVLDRESRIVAANRSFCRRIGAHPEALRGRSCRADPSAVLPCRSNGFECPSARCVASGRAHSAILSIPHADGGSRRIEEVLASPIFDEHGAVVQVVEIWRDISERVRSEEHLAEIERLAAMGALASGFSHEFSTPLASMLLCADSVLARLQQADGADLSGELLPEVRDAAQTIRGQVLRCRSITDQVKRFSRGIPLSVEPIDLRVAAEAAVALARPAAQDAGVALELEPGEALVVVTANTETVQHVLMNLLVNAVQSCEGRGGRVTVSLLRSEPACIRVSDSGCGMAPEDRLHLFEPFRTAKKHGTGLGLFLSRSFMQRFGGDVRLIRSEVGAGSCFEISFAAEVREVTEVP